MLAAHDRVNVYDARCSTKHSEGSPLLLRMDRGEVRLGRAHRNAPPGERTPYVPGGICARIRVPSPGALSIRSVPPRCATRSRIDFKPRCPGKELSGSKPPPVA